MPSLLSSPAAAVLAAAMAVSGALLLLSLRRQPNSQNLRSCISSDDGRRREGKKKRVKFAEGVKDQNMTGERYRKEKKKSISSSFRGTCRSEIRQMPVNRMVLYDGILRDRVRRLECSC